MPKRLIPFSWMPGSWGLRGTTREVAAAEYYLEGEELEHRLVDLVTSEVVERELKHLDIERLHQHVDAYEYDQRRAKIQLGGDALKRELIIIDQRHGIIEDYDFDIKLAEFDNRKQPKNLALAKLAIDLVHEKITAYEHDIKVIELEHKDDVLSLKKAKLAADLKHRKIDKRKYDRELATILEEPYIAIVNSEYDHREGINGLAVEFDWNDLMIEYLRLNGYRGLTDEHVIESWFIDTCQAVAEESQEEMSPEIPPFNSGRVINRIQRDGGKSEYS